MPVTRRRLGDASDTVPRIELNLPVTRTRKLDSDLRLHVQITLPVAAAAARRAIDGNDSTDDHDQDDVVMILIQA